MPTELRSSVIRLAAMQPRGSALQTALLELVAGRASPKQVKYALSLVQRVVRRGGWFDTDWGDTGQKPFTEADLAAMTSAEISEVIDVLQGEG